MHPIRMLYYAFFYPLLPIHGGHYKSINSIILDEAFFDFYYGDTFVNNNDYICTA